MSVLKKAKLVALRIAHATRVDAAIRDSRWRAGRVLILAYHGISLDDEHEWNPELFMPPQLLRERLRRLREGGYAVLPLGDALDRLYRHELPPRAVALTFDDGLHDFAARALPVLQEFEMPATVYLSTYYAERGGPVFDPMCRYLLWKGRGREISGANLTLDGRMLDLRSARGVDRAVHDVFAFARERALSADEKDAVLALLAERVKADYALLLEKRLFHLMTPDEVRALPHELIDVQLHTHRHRVPRQRDLFLREIEDNRRSLDRMWTGTNGGSVHFCYPSGVTHPEFLGWLRDARVQSATTCESGLASSRSDPLMLPRLVDTTPLTSIEFDGWLTGVSGFLPKRRGPAHMAAAADDGA
jgi:peptidoglycan/xylan/chitin deacetylase (PgdA/CDA1 family)